MNWWHKIALREPERNIGPGYMLRWYVIPRNRFFNVYLHLFQKGDDARALHDHPWINFSYLLQGEYTEHTIAAGGISKRQVFKTGDWKFRWPGSAHRIELHRGPCWSLFMTGPRVREWGFHCPQGWRHFTIFGEKDNPDSIGKGCAE
jgi:hypothetical protein